MQMCKVTLENGHKFIVMADSVEFEGEFLVFYSIGIMGKNELARYEKERIVQILIVIK